MARGIVFSTERLRALFEPRSIALVGASDKSAWSWMIHAGLIQGGFNGKIYYINPRNPVVHGQTTFAHLTDIGEPVDLCYIMVGIEAVLPTIQDMIAAGLHNAIVLTGGFAEQDEHGQALQEEITRLAAQHDLAIIGPNCMGYINITHSIEAMANLPERPILAGSIALISQSGALGALMLNYAHTQNVGLSMLISTGNEAVISVTDVLQYAIEDETTRVIALFMETIREPARFVQLARQAFERGKPIVVLKAGRSEATARVALTHTGALTGNDRVIDAVFRQLGIIRVKSVEELILTANAFAKVGSLPGRRLGIVAISGGACDLAADLAEEAGIALPIFSEQTKNELRTLLPILGPANNPLDVTGAALNDQNLMGNILSTVTRDPELDAVLCLIEPPADETPQSRFVMNILGGIDQALKSSPIPAFMLPLTSNDVRDSGRTFLELTGIPFLSGGIHMLIPALGKLMAWMERYQAAQAKGPEQAVSPLSLTIEALGSWSEYQARELLAKYGIPVIPATLATSAEQAAEAARAIGFPVVLKVVSPDIVHKSDIGGVKLDLQSEEEVRKAFTQLMSNVKAATPAAYIEGVLISALHAEGIDLLVSVIRDATWGQVLTLGIGGIWVEALKDISLRILPVTRDDVRAMLTELQGAKLLAGVRGSKPVKMDKLVEVIYRTAALAHSLKANLELLEINPLRVNGSQIEALDALITWQGAAK
ncbi:acetate--CoA ligase family protein [Ktedonosporobacter rubrisoli]|nr:acetate--CoA ligase family protein [Ktedonosporobacter rubrisoli]